MMAAEAVGEMAETLPDEMMGCVVAETTAINLVEDVIPVVAETTTWLDADERSSPQRKSWKARLKAFWSFILADTVS
jgi:hypothetical protein